MTDYQGRSWTRPPAGARGLVDIAPRWRTTREHRATASPAQRARERGLKRRRVQERGCERCCGSCEQRHDHGDAGARYARARTRKQRLMHA
eukprot:1755750-Pleurochrysis_carterae.AAC.1